MKQDKHYTAVDLVSNDTLRSGRNTTRDDPFATQFFAKFRQKRDGETAISLADDAVLLSSTVWIHFLERAVKYRNINMNDIKIGNMLDIIFEIMQ